MLMTPFLYLLLPFNCYLVYSCELFDQPRDDPAWASDVIDFHTLTKDEVETFRERGLDVNGGWSYTSFMIDTSLYLTFLMSEVNPQVL